MTKCHMKKITVIGGGSGSSVVISSLTNQNFDLSSVISVADHGGSTGRLRDEFGFQPVGDLRQALTSMAEIDGQHYLRDLLLYRFDTEKSDLKGHNLGNLLLTALQDIAGNTAEALAMAKKIFRLSGNIYPITTETVDLVIEYTDGTFKIGEQLLDEATTQAKQIKKVRLSPRAKIYQKAAQAIIKSDLVVIGPGDHYASIMAALSVDGIRPTFAKITGRIVYITNLMTRFTQTHGLTAKDHVATIEKQIGRPVDYILINNGPIKPAILKYYETQKEYPVLDDLKTDKRVVRAPLACTVPYKQNQSDTVKRSLLRHDKEVLGQTLASLIIG